MKFWFSVLFSDSPPSSRPVATLQYTGFPLHGKLSIRGVRKLPIGISSSSSSCENSACSKAAPGLKSPPTNQEQKAHGPAPISEASGLQLFWFTDSNEHKPTDGRLGVGWLPLLDPLRLFLDSKQPMAHRLHTIAQGQTVSICTWRQLAWWFLP